MAWQYPDAEAVMCALLEPIAPTCTFLPDDWEENLPVIQVNRVGGGVDVDDVTDTARLQVAVWAGDRATVWALAARIRGAVTQSGGTAPGGILIDRGSEAIAGQQVPDIDPDDSRVISTFHLEFRKQNL